MIMPMIGFLASKGHNIMIKIFNPKKVKNTLSFIKNNIGFFGVKDTFYALYVANKLTLRLACVLSDISKKHSVDGNVIEYQKYLDLDYWILENVRRAFTLGLHNSKPKKILDISTGAGFFPYICRYFEHDVYGTDVSDNDMYNEVINALDIPRVILLINRLEPLRIKGQYDMITSFMICFNSHKTSRMWLEDEWSYFFSDLLPNLNDGGAIYLSFNEEDDNEQSQNDLFNSFKKCSAIVNRNDISLNKKQLQKFVSGLC
jgi:hypothetical protein